MIDLSHTILKSIFCWITLLPGSETYFAEGKISKWNPKVVEVTSASGTQFSFQMVEQQNKMQYSGHQYMEPSNLIFRRHPVLENGKIRYRILNNTWNGKVVNEEMRFGEGDRQQVSFEIEAGLISKIEDEKHRTYLRPESKNGYTEVMLFRLTINPWLVPGGQEGQAPDDCFLTLRFVNAEKSNNQATEYLLFIRNPTVVIDDKLHIRAGKCTF
jgi:hypothetical protein